MAKSVPRVRLAHVVVQVCMVCSTVLAVYRHEGTLTSISSVGDNLQCHTKDVQSSLGPVTTNQCHFSPYVHISPSSFSRAGLAPQQWLQRRPINSSHSALLTTSLLVVLNNTGDLIVQVFNLTCTPRELVTPLGVSGGSSSKPAVMLIMCANGGRVLSLLVVKGQYVLYNQWANNPSASIPVAINMSSRYGTVATGIAYLDQNMLVHHPSYDSASPVIFDVGSVPLQCLSPTLSSFNTTHYFLNCTDSLHLVNKDGSTTSIGSEDGSLAVASDGDTAVFWTSSQAVLRYQHFTKRCTLVVSNLKAIDFATHGSDVIVVLITSNRVYRHVLNHGCPPDSVPSPVAIVTLPSCIDTQRCSGYYIYDEFLFITTSLSTSYSIKAYDLHEVNDNSQNINFVIPNPPLLLNFVPLIHPSSSRTTHVTPTAASTANVTTTVGIKGVTSIIPDPTETPLPIIRVEHLLGLILSCILVVMILLCIVSLPIAICCCKRYGACRTSKRKRSCCHIEMRGMKPLSSESSSLASADADGCGVPIEETKQQVPVQVMDRTEDHHPAGLSHEEKGPQKPDKCVPNNV